jgi:hypothetical protein
MILKIKYQIRKKVNQFTLWNIGYDSDGYDEDKHIWIEYDSPYHDKPRQKEKDIIGQDNIISYFRNINHPLRGFLRVKYDKTTCRIC